VQENAHNIKDNTIPTMGVYGFIWNNRYKCSLAVKWSVCSSSWTNSANKKQEKG